MSFSWDSTCHGIHETTNNESTSNTAQQMQNQTTPTSKRVRKTEIILYTLQIPTIIHIHICIHIKVPHTWFFPNISAPNKNMVSHLSTQLLCSKKSSFFSRFWVLQGLRLAGCVRCFVSCDEHCESPRPWHLGGCVAMVGGKSIAVVVKGLAIYLEKFWWLRFRKLNLEVEVSYLWIS